MIEVTQQTFEQEVLKSDVPVLVDFWAPWCGPCKMLIPVLEQIQSEAGGQAKIVKVNVDDCREFVMELGIKQVPTLIFYKNGEITERLSGANHPKSALKALLGLS
jgi:thioredoxin 1